MGCWIMAKDRIQAIKKADLKLMQEFYRFGGRHYPDDYVRMDEYFSNPWFFDYDGRLTSIAGKFAEPSIWYEHFKEHFFEPRGILVPENIEIADEWDWEFWTVAEARYNEYKDWQTRMENPDSCQEWISHLRIINRNGEDPFWFEDDEDSPNYWSFEEDKISRLEDDEDFSNYRSFEEDKTFWLG